ncbi:MAG TPA: sigma-70 family RNA polymerase sigma factor [Candidatus Acidoferrum sp.]|nr:sigma-70 family RNA polymerase sigma factor [Candidatus Acidoferrum sp.]
MDHALIEQAQQGDRAAFDALVRRKVDAVYGTALAILGHEADAQDAVQEAFVSAWRSLGALRDPDRFDAWFGRILVNACRMSLRRRKVRQIEVTDASIQEVSGGRSPAAGGPAFDDVTASAESFDRAFNRLSGDERAVLVLRHRDDLPVAEIAARLGIPDGTVKSRLFAARRSLQRALAREDR